MRKQAIGVAVLLALGLAGCTEDDGDPQVLFETSLGDFTVELWPDKAPVTVENFLRYVHDGHYDGLTFHRISPGFVVQGGGFLPDHETLRPTRPPIVNEARADVPNEKWTLSMARLGPDSATSQFFINLGDNRQSLDKNAQSAGYAVFGEIVSGRDTIEAMTQVEPGRSFGSAGGYFPKVPIVIEKATQIQGEAPPAPPAEPAAFACPSGSHPASTGVVADTIAPGILCITNVADEVLVWARNFHDVAAVVEWNLTGSEGGPLPEGWTASFGQSQATLGAAGSSSEATHTMLAVQVPEGTEGEFALELRTGNSVTPLTAHVDLRHEVLAREGDAVTVGYAGRCVSDGRAFDDGEFPLTLGGGAAIVGFDRGVIGMGHHESATIYLPAPLAYGQDGGPCAGEQADLLFDVEIRDL